MEARAACPRSVLAEVSLIIYGRIHHNPRNRSTIQPSPKIRQAPIGLYLIKDNSNLPQRGYLYKLKQTIYTVRLQKGMNL
jgi:hypothetical protein